MDRHTRQQEHLLVLEPDESLQDFLSDLLSEEGYQVSVAASLAEGLAWVEQQSFALILAELFVGRSPAGPFTLAHTLCRRVQPTPVGLLMTIPLSAAEVQRAGFAFVLELPFEVEDLLSLVAAALHRSLVLPLLVWDNSLCPPKPLTRPLDARYAWIQLSTS